MSVGVLKNVMFLCKKKPPIGYRERAILIVGEGRRKKKTDSGVVANKDAAGMSGSVNVFCGHPHYDLVWLLARLAEFCVVPIKQKAALDGCLLLHIYTFPVKTGR